MEESQENIIEITPFQNLPFFEYFEHDLEKIMSAYRLSNSIRIGLKNTSGDTTRTCVRQLTDMSPTSYCKMVFLIKSRPFEDFNSFSRFIASCFVSKNST